MKFDLDRVVVVASEYNQHHGEGIYDNEFAQDVLRHLKTHLESSDSDSLSYGTASISFHNNKEVQVKVNPNVRGRHVYYFHQFRGYDGEYDPNVGYMALYAVSDALAGVGRADQITHVLPHMPYLRSDWAPKSRVPILSKQHAILTEASALGKLVHIITMDLHSPQQIAFYPTIRPDNLPLRPAVVEKFREVDDNVGVVAFDSGAVKPSRKLRNSFSKSNGGVYVPFIIVDKDRPEDGTAEVDHIIGNPKGLTLIGLEDILDTGGTIAEGAKALLKAGAEKVYACATDGLFSSKWSRKKGVIYPMPALNESGVNLLIGNTIPFEDGFLDENSDRVEVLDTTPVFARAIYETETIGSVSSLYDD